MNPARRLLLPALVALLVAAPVWWAFPAALTFWRSSAIVSGWGGCGLLLASLLLMQREPRLARWLGGLERIYRWHHWLGSGAYLILLLHPLALAADAWNEAPAQAWATLAPWQQGWPVWLGWAALLTLMAGLAAALAPRLRYAWWRRLHLLLVLAVLCGFGHLLLLGLDAALLWAPVLATLLMLWRALRADVGLAAQPYVVTRVTHPASDLVEVSLQPLGRAIAAQPGQFVFAAFGDGPNFHGCGEYHPFSISANSQANGTSVLALGIKALGDCTQHLQQLEPGVAVRLQGPFGEFLSPAASGPSLWIAGGIGITPFLAQLRAAVLQQPVHLIYLHRSTGAAHDTAYLAELQQLAQQQPALRLEVLATGDQPPDLAPLLPAGAELLNHACYLCGPPGLVDAAYKLLQSRGVPPGRIHFERFEFR